MSSRYSTPLLVLMMLTLAGCQQLAGLGRSSVEPPEAGITVAVQTPDDDTTRPQPRGGEAAPRSLGSVGLRPESLDQVSAEDREAARAPAGTRTQLLGETLAALGSPTEPGLWLRTGLVSVATQGRVELQEASGSLRVELRPSGAAAGAGSQMSLSAFNELGVPLTQLVRLRVYAE